MNQTDLAFVLRYCWECSHEPYTGSATEQLHALGVEHGDMIPVFAELKCDLADTAPPEVTIPWRTQAKFREQIASLIWEHKHERLAADLKRLHDRWVLEVKDFDHTQRTSLFAKKVLPELETCWDTIDGETKGKVFALFMLHLNHDGYPYADVALYAELIDSQDYFQSNWPKPLLYVAEELPDPETKSQDAQDHDS